MDLHQPTNAGLDAARDGHGRFRKGQSGNPAGKRLGKRNTLNEKLDALAAAEVEAVLKSVLAQARSGDLEAAKVILARSWPQRKGRPVRLHLPDIKAPNGAAAATEAVMQAVTTGQIAPDEAEQLVRAIAGHADVMKSSEILSRLEALEGDRGPRLRAVP